MPLINHYYGNIGTPQLCRQVDNFTVTAGMLTATLTWTAPATDEDSSFVGTRIVRKVGSAPKNKSDGTVVYEGTEFTYTDTGLTKGTTYYYRAFAYNAKKKYQTALCVVSLVAQSISATLNDNSWEIIRSVSDAGNGANYWSVGDCKEIELNGTIGAFAFSNYNICVFIIGFNHNAELEGANRIHFQLGKTALTNGTDIALYESGSGVLRGFEMNRSNTRSGGWKGSYMRTTYCGISLSDYSGTILEIIPDALRNTLKSVIKYTHNTSGTASETAVTATTDYFFLLSEYEISGSHVYANFYEQAKQEQYSYYSAGNSVIRYSYNNLSSAVDYWLRSPYPMSDSTTFVRVYANGSVATSDSVGANRSFGFAPCFCV